MEGYDPLPLDKSVQCLKGTNDIALNDETMQKAIEYWLNETVFRAPVKVYGITQNRQTEVYTVSFEPLEK